MDLESLVAVVTEEVRRALAARAERPQRLLVLMTGTPCHEGRIKAELARLRDSGRFQPTLLLSRTAAGTWDRAGLKAALGCGVSLDESSAPTPPELVWAADQLLVPWLSLNTASKLALGICDTPVTSVLMMALLKGLPVVACAEQADPASEALRGWAHPTPALAGMLRDHLARLQSFGITLVKHGELASALLGESPPGRSQQEAAAPPKEALPAYPAARPLITAAEVRTALAAGSLDSLPANGIWTPLARELTSAWRCGG